MYLFWVQPYWYKAVAQAVNKRTTNGCYEKLKIEHVNFRL